MTWTSTGTFFWPTVATVTGTSPPPRRPPPFPPASLPPPAPAALAPEFEQAAPVSRRTPANTRAAKDLDTASPLHREGAHVGIERIHCTGVKDLSYSYAPQPGVARKGQRFWNFLYSLGLGGGSSRAATGSMKPVR